MKPGELLARIFWRVGPILLIVWAVRSGAIDYKKYIRMIQGETKTPAQIQVETIAELLIDQYAKDRSIPDQYRLAYWLTQNPGAKALGGAPHIDPFGGQIRVARQQDGFTVSSDGPDKKPKTADDITHKVEGLEKLAVERQP